MGRRNFWVSRAAGGALAGVLMAGAGVGVAMAGATGSADQYTKGAKPYAGVAPHDVTVGTNTYPSTVTTNITNTTVTQPYDVTVPYTVTTTSPTELAELQTAAAEIAAQNTVLTAFLKDDLRRLLQPTGNYLKTTTLSRATAVTFAFESPGSGKISVQWKFGVPGRNHNAGVYYVNYSGSLHRVGAISVRLPTTAVGRGLLSGAKKGNALAVVTYTNASGASLKVTRAYRLVG